jgi:hypothetical protein
MAKDQKDYELGEEVTITGVLTSLGDNGGNPEYTIAVNNEDTERPISVRPKVAPQAFAIDQAEVLALNHERNEELQADAEKADKEKAAERDDDEVNGGDSPADVRAKTVTPDPAKAPAGRGADAAKTATTRK